MTTIRSQWDIFETLLLQQASERERNQAEVSFYAGVVALLNLQRDLALKGITQQQAMEIHSGWLEEISTYSELQANKNKPH
jgi:hypothetical protein